MKITIRDSHNFVEGHLLYFLGNKLRPSYISEQALFRAIKCYPCLKAGKCLKCGCKTPHMFFSRYKVDPDKKWGVMLGQEEWEVYKRTDDYRNTIREINKYVDLEKYGYDKELLKSVSRNKDDNEGEELQNSVDSSVNSTPEKSVLQSDGRGETSEDTGRSLSTGGGGTTES